MNLEAEMAAGPQCAASFPAYQESSILRKAYTAGLKRWYKTQVSVLIPCPGWPAERGYKWVSLAEHQWRTPQTKRSVKAYNWVREFWSVLLLLTSQFAACLLADTLTILSKWPCKFSLRQAFLVLPVIFQVHEVLGFQGWMTDPRGLRGKMYY